jgi:hypothetical protein
MRKVLLFASAVLLVLTGCATVGISHGSAPPVNLVIMTESPMRQGDADLLRTITEDYLRQYVHGGQALTLTLSLSEYQPMYLSGGLDASSRGGYYGPENFNASYSGHTVPLVGGTAVSTGFQPRVGGGGGGWGSAYLPGIVMARYSITDASGKVLESRSFMMYPSAYLYGIGTQTDARLSAFHETANYVAKRVAQTH